MRSLGSEPNTSKTGLAGSSSLVSQPPARNDKILVRHLGADRENGRREARARGSMAFRLPHHDGGPSWDARPAPVLMAQVNPDMPCVKQLATAALAIRSAYAAVTDATVRDMTICLS